MLSSDMQSIITTHSCGFVATIDGDGLPAVSPKATFLVVDDRTIACGNIRSPGTAKNLRANACIARAASPELVTRFEQAWADYLPHMTGFFVFDIAHAKPTRHALSAPTRRRL
jgi:hypothetical protein